MALSPNYGFPEPDNSSLVKNGAQDIRALGDAVDTAVWNVGFGQAGKNKIINGNFGVNQRSFTSLTTSGSYTYDRFLTRLQGDGTSTYSAQTFTAGTAPVAGYEGTNFLRIVTTGQTAANSATAIWQRIESVRTFAGQTATVSFWAKANTGTPKIGVGLVQNFGSGGSPSSQVYTFGTSPTISTSWARYSVTIAVPSIAGKTLGTTAGTDYLNLSLATSVATGENAFFGDTGGIQSNTIEIWGVQAEYGSKATPFQTASGSIQGELAMCQRYYYRVTFHAGSQRLGVGYCDTTTGATITIPFPVTMRTNPSALEQSGTAGDYSLFTSIGTTVCSAIPNFQSATSVQAMTGLTVAAGLTAGAGAFVRNVNTSAYFGWSAEL
jgi:hypothetical protein